MAISFDNKTVLVIGGSTGIGLACVQQLAERGARVIGTCRDPEKAILLSAQLRDQGHDVAFEAVDISDERSIDDLFQRLHAQYLELHGAVNNAGMTQDAFHVADTPREVVDELIAVNLKGTFLAMQHEIRWMQAQGAGAIVNVASIAGLRGVKNLAMYSATKHAVIGMTKVAAQDTAADGIRINATCPGTTRTEMMARQMQTRQGGEQATLETIPMRRASSPDEQARAIIWLLSDDASYVTGETITVDGGRTID